MKLNDVRFQFIDFLNQRSEMLKTKQLKVSIIQYKPCQRPLTTWQNLRLYYHSFLAGPGLHKYHLEERKRLGISRFRGKVGGRIPSAVVKHCGRLVETQLRPESAVLITLKAMGTYTEIGRTPD